MQFVVLTLTYNTLLLFTSMQLWPVYIWFVNFRFFSNEIHKEAYFIKYLHRWLSIWHLTAFFNCVGAFFILDWWRGRWTSRLRPLEACRISTGSLVTKGQQINEYILVLACAIMAMWSVKIAQFTAAVVMLAFAYELLLVLICWVCWYNLSLGAGTGLALTSGWSSCASLGCQKYMRWLLTFQIMHEGGSYYPHLEYQQKVGMLCNM